MLPHTGDGCIKGFKVDSLLTTVVPFLAQQWIFNRFNITKVLISQTKPSQFSQIKKQKIRVALQYAFYERKYENMINKLLKSLSQTWTAFFSARYI